MVVDFRSHQLYLLGVLRNIQPPSGQEALAANVYNAVATASAIHEDVILGGVQSEPTNPTEGGENVSV